jgi:hypothetical protein
MCGSEYDLVALLRPGVLKEEASDGDDEYSTMVVMVVMMVVLVVVMLMVVMVMVVVVVMVIMVVMVVMATIKIQNRRIFEIQMHLDDCNGI